MPAGPEPIDGDPLAGLVRGRLGHDPAFVPARSTIAHSIVLMVTGVSSRLSVQDASHGAGQMRPVNSGKLLVECRLQTRVLPVAAIDEIVPVGDLVVDRAAMCGNRECRNSCSAPPDRASPARTAES